VRRTTVPRWAAFGAAVTLATLVIILDRGSKLWAEQLLVDGPQPWLPGFIELRLAYNTGAAWGIFSGAQPVFLVIAALTILVALAYLFSQKGHPPLVVVGLGLFIGGSSGNALSRLMDGHVVDFLRFQFIEFPIFNLADIGITLGVGLLLLAIIISMLQPKQSPAASHQQVDTDLPTIGASEEHPKASDQTVV